MSNGLEIAGESEVAFAGGDSMSEQNCLFCRIISGQIPAEIIYSDDQAIAFRDINPQAPVHALVIPRRHIHSLNEVASEDAPAIGYLFKVAADIAKQEGIAESGYRTVVNTGSGAGQSVFHVHVHVLGGRGFHWPPG
jgi:histidine triad (HIT) family protein